MKTKLASLILAVFVLTLFSTALYAKVKTFEGTVSGEIVCLFDWTTKEEYQGSKAVCVNPEHDRALVAEGGQIYILEPDDKAGEDVIKSVRTRVLERKKVVIQGEIATGGPVNIIKVKSIKVKE